MSSTSREVVSLVPESEQRITEYVDRRVGELDAKLEKRLDRQDQLLEKMDVKTDRINDLLITHITSEGHPVQTVRVENLANRIEETRGLPKERWFWLTGVAGLVVMAINLLFGCIYVFNIVFHLIHP